MPINLTDIRGVGPAMADRLRAVGYSTVESVAKAHVEGLTLVQGIGPQTAPRLIEAASQAMSAASASDTVGKKGSSAKAKSKKGQAKKSKSGKDKAKKDKAKKEKARKDKKKDKDTKSKDKTGKDKKKGKAKAPKGAKARRRRARRGTMPSPKRRRKTRRSRVPASGEISRKVRYPDTNSSRAVCKWTNQQGLTMSLTGSLSRWAGNG